LFVVQIDPAGIVKLNGIPSGQSEAQFTESLHKSGSFLLLLGSVQFPVSIEQERLRLAAHKSASAWLMVLVQVDWHPSEFQLPPTGGVLYPPIP
jgi:hypothetical protein